MSMHNDCGLDLHAKQACNVFTGFLGYAREPKIRKACRVIVFFLGIDQVQHSSLDMS